MGCTAYTEPQCLYKAALYVWIKQLSQLDGSQLSMKHAKN